MVYVTGATGLLGSHLLYFLAKSGQEVLALCRIESRTEDCRSVFRQYPDGELLWDKIKWTPGDVLNRESLVAGIKAATCVYHCAAMVSFSGEDKSVLMRTNLQGSENVASLCLEYRRRLCYVSSIAALGDASFPGEWIDENTPEISGREHSVYSGSKGSAEKIIWNFIARGLEAVIVNPSVILGAGMWGRSSSRLFLAVAKGMPVYTGGVNGYVDVRDVCGLMVRLGEDTTVRGQRFILNGGNYSYRELFTVMAKATGHRPPFLYMAPWLSGVAWRLLAVAGKLSGGKPAFTRETANSSQHRSWYASGKILSLYPDYHFYTLPETVDEIRRVYLQREDVS